METPLKSSKKNNLAGYFGILIIPFVTFLLGLTVGYNQAKHDVSQALRTVNGNMVTVQSNTPSEAGGKNIDMTLFWDVWNKLANTYIDTGKLDEATMVYGAIKGMVSSLSDPYTLFMTPKETEEFRNSLSGDLQGIGAELSVKEGHIVIVSPLKDSPAEKAGLLPGDIIYKIGEELTTNMSLTDAISRIRGKKGTQVQLSIIRQGKETPLEFRITRQEIRIPSVSWEMKEESIAYISINQFGDDTTKEFGNAVNQILLKKPKGIILDLRFNGGGYLDGAVDIVSEFIGGDTIVTTVRRRDASQDEMQRVSGHPRLADIPLVVLINAGSASASEIVAGAIQDLRRGTIMGEKSFGKGTVQELEPLADGSSLRVTIAKWLTPNGSNVNETGIIPDKEVKNVPSDDGKLTQDVQLQEAMMFLKSKFPSRS